MRSEWRPVPYNELPLLVAHWNGHNDRTAPKWAKSKLSVLDVVNNHQNFTTLADIQETDDQFLLKITSANGLNFCTRLEIKMGLDPASGMPDNVVIYETTTDKSTGHKLMGTVLFPATHMSQVILSMDDLLTKEFPPLKDDKLLTDMVLFHTDFTEYSGHHHHITFQMRLMVVSVHGTKGIERMIRLKQMNTNKESIVQFPWVHLPRVLELWRGFQKDMRCQLNLARGETPVTSL